LFEKSLRRTLFWRYIDADAKVSFRLNAQTNHRGSGRIITLDSIL